MIAIYNLDVRFRTVVVSMVYSAGWTAICTGVRIAVVDYSETVVCNQSCIVCCRWCCTVIVACICYLWLACDLDTGCLVVVYCCDNRPFAVFYLWSSRHLGVSQFCTGRLSVAYDFCCLYYIVGVLYRIFRNYFVGMVITSVDVCRVRGHQCWV